MNGNKGMSIEHMQQQWKMQNKTSIYDKNNFKLISNTRLVHN